jgi:hypothetical protein
MRRLSNAVKQRIVEHLACYQSHAEVVALILEEFGLALTPRHVRVYDPQSFQFAASHQWLDYHCAVRERFRSEIGNIAIFHKAFRLQRLEDLFIRASEQGDGRQAAKLLEQAAKEMGNWYHR